jgi:hypothetical protein
VVEVEGVEVEFSADVLGAIGAKDVEGEASASGEDSRFCANSTVIFEEGYVTDIMAAVLNAPVRPDGGTGGGGGHRRLAGIKRGFGGRVPKAGFGVFAPGQATHPGGGDDQAIPIGSETTADIEGFDETMLLPAMFVAIDGFGAVGGGPGGAEGFDRVVQDRLVVLDLGDQDVSRVPGRLKCFFDSAWRRR